MKLKPPALTIPEFYTGLAVKVLMGLMYGYIFLQVYQGDDTWRIHEQSLEETKILLQNPSRFFTEQYTPLAALQNTNSFGKFISVYTNDLEYALIVKTLSIFNLVSQGNYYINVFLFNCILIWGHYWLFLLFTHLFPYSRRQLYVTIFLFLPAVFWLSGIRVDGLLFFFLALFLLNIYRKKTILSLAGLAGMIALRAPFALLTVLATLPYLIACSTKKNPAIIFISSYIIFILIFFISSLEVFVVEAQQKFFLLKGTRFEMDELQPSIASFIKLFPSAFNHVFLRPYLWEAASALQFFYALEVLTFWIIIISSIIYMPHAWKQRLSEPFVWMILFVAITTCLLYGYIVPFPGAIARYRIIPELLLVSLTPLLFNYRKI